MPPSTAVRFVTTAQSSNTAAPVSFVAHPVKA